MSKVMLRTLCGLEHYPVHTLYRILRSDDSTPIEVSEVGKAIYIYGKKHNLPGWEDLEHV